MPLALDLSVDLKELKRLDGLKGKARFEAAKALTRTAKDAQAALKAQVPGLFHLRNSWIMKGIRIDPATPAVLTARVGSIDKYMDRHVIGAGHGDKRPGKALSIRGTRDANGRLSSGGLLIRGYGSIGEVPTHTVVRRQMGRADTTRRKTFQIMGTDGQTVLIVRRTSKERSSLRILGVLKGEAHVRARWDMQATVTGTVTARFMDHYVAGLEAAVARG